MNSDQVETLKQHGYNDFVGHTLQVGGRCKCGASEWPHRIALNDKPCFTGGGWHNFAADGICQDCGNARVAR
jgi:hypothetical protein